MSTVKDAWAEAGFDPEAFRLDTAAADFYLLDEIERGCHVKPSFRQHREQVDERLAQNFAGYFEYAVTTELWYLTSGEYDGGWCGGEYTYGESCSCSCEDTCEDCSCERCPCTCDIECEFCDESPDYTKTSNVASVDEYLGMLQGTTSSWVAWAMYKKRQGLVPALKMAVEAFRLDGWSDSYGGDSWASIAALVLAYRSGEVTRRTFVDRCWTLKHNGGCAFDKAGWRGETRLYEVLERQARGEWDWLLGIASSKTRALWGLSHGAYLMERDVAWLGGIPDYLFLLSDEILAEYFWGE